MDSPEEHLIFVKGLLDSVQEEFGYQLSVEYLSDLDAFRLETKDGRYHFAYSHFPLRQYAAEGLNHLLALLFKDEVRQWLVSANYLESKDE